MSVKKSQNCGHVMLVWARGSGVITRPGGVENLGRSRGSSFLCPRKITLAFRFLFMYHCDDSVHSRSLVYKCSNERVRILIDLVIVKCYLVCSSQIWDLRSKY